MRRPFLLRWLALTSVLVCGIADAAPSPFSHTFLREAGNPDGFPHVMYEPVLRLTAQPDAEVLYEIIEPYFERSWNQSRRNTPHA